MYDRDRLLARVDLAGLADELLGAAPRPGPVAHVAVPEPEPRPDRPHPAGHRSSTATAGIERWHCHGCGAGGTAIDLVMAVRRVDVREALEASRRPSPELRSDRRAPEPV